jgi:glutamyl-tRNA synthetase
MNKVRTRFAPSPTGFLHIGSLRTALYNYLYAKKNDGAFLLRIEDTDQKRYVEGATEHLISILNEFNLLYDEGPNINEKFGPYIQSQRTEIYRKYAQELIEQKSAYHCFCTAERLEEMRKQQTEQKKAPMYDRKCVHLTPEEIEQKKAEGIPYVIRQLIPHGNKFEFEDLIRGKVTFDTSLIDDQVLMKSDNYPTYHLANVVDDHLMEITHVIRGEEWLPSTPKHILLYNAFKWTPPEFAHIPLLLNKDKSKLSKRQGDVNVEDYLKKGYRKEAIINFIALLGWHPGEGIEKEIFSLDELIQDFSMERVHKAGAIFDIEKLNWVNFVWQKKLHHEKLQKIAKEIEPEVKIEENEKKERNYIFSKQENTNLFVNSRGQALLDNCKQFLKDDYLEKKELLIKALITQEERILKTPSQINENIDFYFNPKEPDQDLLVNEKMKVDKDIAKKSLQKTIDKLEDFNNFEDIEKVKETLINLAVDLNLKNGQLLWPLRVALSREQFSPGVFELIWALGKEETLKRIHETLNKLS